MRQHHALRRAVRLAVTLAASVACGALVAAVGCGTDMRDIWICLNPATGKLDTSIYDANHYAGDVFDPCHCYDPCGPREQCPIVVDAGTPDTECDAGGGEDAGP